MVTDAGARGRYARSRDVALLTAGRLGAAVLSAIWMVVAARLLEPDEFGQLAVLLSVGLISSLFADLGVPFVLTAAVMDSGTIALRTLWRVVLRRVPGGVLACAATLGAFLVVAEGSNLLAPLVFSLSIITTLCYSTVYAAMRGLGSAATEATNEFGGRVVLLIVGAVTLSCGGGLIGAVWAYVVADATTFVAVVVVTRHRWSDDDTIDLTRFSARSLAGTSAARLLAAMQRRIDVWVIALVGGNSLAGLYAAPARLLDGLLLAPRSFGALEVGGLARSAPMSMARSTALLMAPIAAVCALLAGPIVTFVLGDGYARSAGAARILFVAAVPAAVNNALLPRWSVDLGWRLTVVLAPLVLGGSTLVAVVARHGSVASVSWVTLLTESLLAAMLVAMSWVDQRRRSIRRLR